MPRRDAFQRQAHAIAVAFAREVRAELLPLELRLVTDRNRVRRGNTCATHDFCDANELMERAFAACNVVTTMAEGAALWDAAWDLARRAEFALRPAPFYEEDYSGRVLWTHEDPPTGCVFGWVETA